MYDGKLDYSKRSVLSKLYPPLKLSHCHYTLGSSAPAHSPGSVNNSHGAFARLKGLNVEQNSPSPMATFTQAHKSNKSLTQADKGFITRFIHVFPSNLSNN